ncbi:MAG: ATP-binding protein, partial [bacterium]
ISASPIIKEGKIVGMRISLADVTELKKAEAERLEIEARFQETADMLPTIVMETNLDMMITYINRAGHEAFGGDESDAAAGIHTLDYLHPDDRALAISRLSNTKSGARLDPQEYRMIRKDGSMFYALINSSPIIKDGKLNGMRFSMTDVTNLKEADEAMRDYSAFQSVLAMTRGVPPDATEAMLWDIFLSAIIENYGFKMAWYGKYENNIVKPDIWAGHADKYLDGLVLDIREPNSPDARCAMCRAILDQAPFSYSDLAHDVGFTRWRDYALELGYASNLAIPLAVEGRICGGVMLYSDKPAAFKKDRIERLSLLVREVGMMLSERRRRKRGEEEWENLQAQLFQAQKMEAIGTLAGGMAHDFNNILAVIMGSTDTILATLPEDDPNNKRVQRILKSSRRARDLTMKLLTFARKEKLDVKPHSVNGIVNEVIDMLKRTVDKNISFETTLMEDIANISADSNQIQQALLNICMNAADSMPNGGALTIKTFETVPSAELQRSYPDLDNIKYCVIQIIDTGTGMPAEVLERIFEPFFTTKAKGKGTGLGLPVSLGIIRNHGGALCVDSKPNIGTVFEVFIPASNESEISFKIIHAADTALNSETILIVDDDRDYLDVTAESLGSDGFGALTAESGLQAVDLYKKHADEIAVVLLDVRMPKAEDGKETFDALMKINPRLKVIICTGFSRDSHTVELENKGARHFLQKPYDFKSLRRKIREVIDGE